jgi:predicted glycogen debranching enzyme
LDRDGAVSLGYEAAPGVALPVDERTEWLEADGLGGFSSGTTSGVRTHRYHALLLAAARPPADRRVLVSGFLATLHTPAGSAEFWPQVYGGGWTTGRQVTGVGFTRDPWPRWRIATTLGVTVSVELFVPRGHPAVVVAFKLESRVPGARLEVRPLLAGRDFHASHKENGAFQFTAERAGKALRFEPYPDVPAILSLSNGEYRAAPDWFRGFHYAEEAARGLDATEDLASPGVLTFDLAAGEALWVLGAELPSAPPLVEEPVEVVVARLRETERVRRSGFDTTLEREGSAYLVRRGEGLTLVAGYPWFGDWGRDTFIALRGLCLATGRYRAAASIVGEWAEHVSEGMLPNRFPDDAGSPPEYNAVDASLWFVLAADELLEHPRARRALSARRRATIEAAIGRIVVGYSRGTRFGIHTDDDGLLASGEPGVQLTWMDAKYGDHVVTPRIGKPVEVQALWVHALLAAGRRDSRFLGAAESARTSLRERFWNAERRMLYDVVDDGHVPGRVDAACRPNQLFAAGGLPVTLLPSDRARLVVDAVERELWTPLGVRSLERGHPAYHPRYEGGVAERDRAYHQGTAWPWLVGPFVEAWVKSRGRTRLAKAEARLRFVEPLRQHLREAGLGHVSEIVDAEPPHRPRGCPFQAWSLAELIRLERVVLADDDA